MLDKAQPRSKTTGPRLDFQQHLADLEAAGLLIRIDRPINKDSELIPLVRWQFIGGVAESERRAFLFTHVIDAKGRKYDMPVVVGALAASPAIYALGMGRPVEEIGEAWMAAINAPIPPVRTNDAPCQEVVVTGDALRTEGLKALPVPVSTPGFDAAPYLTATLCITRDPGERRAELRHLSRRAESAGPRGGAHGGARGDRRRRLSALAEVSRAQGEDADRRGGRGRADRDVHRPAEARGRHGRDGRRRRRRRRADPHGALPHRRSRRAGGQRDRGRGPDRSGAAGARGAVRREQRLCRARSLQHADAGHRDHPQEQAGVHPDHQPGDAERVERDQEGGLRAAVPGAPEAATSASRASAAFSCTSG